MTTPRTSLTHPLQIAGLDVPGHPGRLGLTLCPSKQRRGDHIVVHCKGGLGRTGLVAALERLALDLAWATVGNLPLPEDAPGS